jgi:hypothetical protein
MNAKADLAAGAAAGRAAQQPDDIPEPAGLVLAGDAGRDADAALPGGPGQGNGGADARLPSGRDRSASRRAASRRACKGQNGGGFSGQSSSIPLVAVSIASREMWAGTTATTVRHPGWPRTPLLRPAAPQAEG